MQSLNILMIGWEYPPEHSGGLGIASQGLARALSRKHKVTFVMPKNDQSADGKISIVSAASVHVSLQKQLEHLEEIEIGVELLPYIPARYFKKSDTTKKIDEDELEELIGEIALTGNYADNMFTQVKKYALQAAGWASGKDFDIIHAHDWMALRAGVAVKRELGIPLVGHIHSTEMDRNGVFANPQIRDLEREGLQKCDRVIVVSNRTKKQLMDHYRIKANKIHVVPNGTDPIIPATAKKHKTVRIGFVGRLVDQKAPGTFLEIARSLASRYQNVEFEVIGDGYLKDELKQKLVHYNLLNQFTFHGFLSPAEVLKHMKALDLVIQPSVAEPFGLVALEAALLKVPVVISSHAGICEFVSLPSAESWNVYGFVQLAEKLINDPSFKDTTVNRAYEQASQLTWAHSASMVVEVYQKLV